MKIISVIKSQSEKSFVTLRTSPPVDSELESRFAALIALKPEWTRSPVLRVFFTSNGHITISPPSVVTTDFAKTLTEILTQAENSANTSRQTAKSQAEIATGETMDSLQRIASDLGIPIE